MHNNNRLFNCVTLNSYCMRISVVERGILVVEIRQQQKNKYSMTSETKIHEEKAECWKFVCASWLWLVSTHFHKIFTTCTHTHTNNMWKFSQLLFYVPFKNCRNMLSGCAHIRLIISIICENCNWVRKYLSHVVKAIRVFVYLKST